MVENGYLATGLSRIECDFHGLARMIYSFPTTSQSLWVRTSSVSLDKRRMQSELQNAVGRLRRVQLQSSNGKTKLRMACDCRSAVDQILHSKTIQRCCKMQEIEVDGISEMRFSEMMTKRCHSQASLGLRSTSVHPHHTLSRSLFLFCRAI